MANPILKSSTGGVGPLPVLTTPLTHDLPITTINIDTAPIGVSSVLLTFTAQINMTAELNANLVFNIMKVVDDGPAVKIGPSFVFSSVAEIFEAETFAFQYCDEDIRAGVYSYSVQLASNSFIGVAAGLTVTNGTLTGLAVPR